jgi:hypothetical protein
MVQSSGKFSPTRGAIWASRCAGRAQHLPLSVFGSEGLIDHWKDADEGWHSRIM